MKHLIFSLLICVTSMGFSQNKVAMSIDEPSTCAALQSQTLDFLIDGSFQNTSVVYKEVKRLETCGLDEYDVRFFGRIEVLSTLLKKMTKDQLIDRLTYADLLTSINDMRNTANYGKVKNIAVLSQKLAETKANIRTWETDIQLFNELGASQQVIDKVYKYLREHPENELTYQELLMNIKK